MKVPGKCSYCGAEGDDVFIAKPPEPSKPKAKGENLYISGFILMIASFLMMSISLYWFIQWRETEDEMEARFEEAYEDSCWVARVQQDLGLPEATNEELWCEAHGHCGPARQSLAAMLDDCDKELMKLLPQYNEALEKLTTCRKDEAAALDDEHEAVLLLEAYAEASIDSMCAEEVQKAWEWAQDWEVKYFDCAQKSHRDYVKIEYAEDRLGRRIDEKTALAWWEADL